MKVTYCQDEEFNDLQICQDDPFFDCFEYNLFNHKKYQANNFAINKNGDLLLELTEFSEYNELTSSRLFYGLTKDGRYFFSNQSSYTHELNINIDEDAFDEYDYYNYYKIYNSINLFVTIKNDPNKGNEYLFSINPYKMMVELHKFNNINNTHHIWNFN